ncbi:kielin/chordin-like protein isoform X2 [Stegodyphus dumicola]|uniref:kielin/chordin-like protein isoform X2 n=1 Tax=Stegodyphus dumicola TaxID=202533 RepID=UPI0015B14D06|nr:kielin/chordin-like protein isoform X2 [Stegodyphus dumicola]
MKFVLFLVFLVSVWGYEKQISPCQCDKRYFKHYEVKGCSPVYEKDCCPVRFKCPQPEQIPSNVCKYNGHFYDIGTRILTSNPCEICDCEQNSENKRAAINCIPVECPTTFGKPLNHNCYEVYEKDKCCSTSTICDEAMNRTETCKYRGKTYFFGQNIYSDEDPCKTCICSEEWAGINGPSCYNYGCIHLEEDLKQLQEGCIPIYHEATCCPIEIYCGRDFEPTTVPLASNADIKSGKSCEFQGFHYKLGQTLDINHPTNCVTCTCSTPPDFTCIHRMCPGPPNGDYKNCYPSYSPAECCPIYECRKTNAT